MIVEVSCPCYGYGKIAAASPGAGNGGPSTNLLAANVWLGGNANKMTLCAATKPCASGSMRSAYAVQQLRAV